MKIRSICSFVRRGVPSQIKNKTNILTPVHDSDLFNSRNAKALFTYRGRLMDVITFDRDPLEDFQELKPRREAGFLNHFVIFKGA